MQHSIEARASGMGRTRRSNPANGKGIMRMRSLVLVGFLFLPYAAMAEQIILVCHMVPATPTTQPPIAPSFLVDLDKRSVNGYPALISDKTISWERATSDGESYVTRIDRLSGAVTVANRKAGVTFTGNCERVAQPKS